jgi:hypothetical protein
MINRFHALASPADEVMMVMGFVGAQFVAQLSISPGMSLHQMFFFQLCNKAKNRGEIDFFGLVL